MNVYEALEEIEACGANLELVQQKIKELFPQIEPMPSGRVVTQNEFTRQATAIYDEHRAASFGDR